VRDVRGARQSCAPGPGLGARGVVNQDFDIASVPTPATRHRVNNATNDFGLFNRQFPAHGEVVERTNSRCLDHVETSQIATSVASVTIHATTLIG